MCEFWQVAKKQPVKPICTFCHCAHCVVPARIRSFLAPTCCHQAPFSWWDPSLSMPIPVEDLSGSDPDVITIQLIVAENWIWYELMIFDGFLLRSEAEGGQETVMFQIWHCHGNTREWTIVIAFFLFVSVVEEVVPMKNPKPKVVKASSRLFRVDCFKFWWLMQAVKRPAKKPPKAGL